MLRTRKIAFIYSVLAFALSLFIGWTAKAQNAPSCGSFFYSIKPVSFANQLISEIKINSILIETIESTGNITSRQTVNSSEALEVGLRWLGSDNYSQVGRPDSGVFLSADKKRRFRIDRNSIMGSHSPGKPHIHLELLNPLTLEILSNNHVLLVD